MVDTLTKLNMWKRARDVCEKFAIKEERKEFTSEFYDAKSGTWVRRTLEKAKVRTSCDEERNDDVYSIKESIFILF